MTTTDDPNHLEIDIHELLSGRRQIAHIWSIEDVQEVRPDLDDDNAWKVLQTCKRYLDSNYGITWDVIEITADELFPLDESRSQDISND